MKRHYFHTIVLGSGAAGLAAAVRLRAAGIETAIVTEGLRLGTSLNAGSDKQTYYKLGLSGRVADSAGKMAESYLAGGSADGRLALIESLGSVGAFFHLVQLGVPFPHDVCGGFAGYKTDHDPRRRATSCGPYTSREMCRALYREARRRETTIFDRRAAVKLFTIKDAANGGKKRIAGFIAVNLENGEPEIFTCENLIFAVGGPGGLYAASVYPAVHLGGIGLALEIGAEAVSLPESQFGLASCTSLAGRRNDVPPDDDSNTPPDDLIRARCEEFRWNVSGTYMQVLPRVVSVGETNGVSGGKAGGNSEGDSVEFLRDYYSNDAETLSALFLKGYQWPFDARRTTNGSSLIDLAVLCESLLRRRRVFLDFRTNPTGLDFAALSVEARDYLEKSGALFGRPIERLRAMNPAAVELYREQGIDLEREPLEIKLCAQHNNGGLAGNLWYESTNIARLFPIGEVNGSHGVARPGGSALNAGQVGAFRAAEYIAARGSERTLDSDAAQKAADAAMASLTGETQDAANWKEVRAQLQERMSAAAGPLRSLAKIDDALEQTRREIERLERGKIERQADEPVAANAVVNVTKDAVEALRNRSLLIAAECYLSAIRFQLTSGVGSRGSALVIDAQGETIHRRLPDDWRKVPEDVSFRDKTLRTLRRSDGESEKIEHRWTAAAPIPTPDDWFETVWREFRDGTIYDTK